MWNRTPPLTKNRVVWNLSVWDKDEKKRIANETSEDENLKRSNVRVKKLSHKMKKSHTHSETTHKYPVSNADSEEEEPGQQQKRKRILQGELPTTTAHPGFVEIFKRYLDKRASSECDSDYDIEVDVWEEKEERMS